MLESILILILAVITGYAWILYPGLIVIAGNMRRNKHDARAVRPLRVTLVFSAYNEESVISAKLKQCDQIMEKLKADGYITRVLVGIDGSSDRTLELANKQAASMRTNAKIVAYAGRRGKSAVIKDVVSLALADTEKADLCRHILVFTDANTCISDDAMGRMLPHFANESTGGVCGRLLYSKSCLLSEIGNSSDEARASDSEEGLYWEWERGLKRAESAVDSCLGANGALYAIRGNLFPDDFASNTIVDDFVIGMKVREQGFRMLFEDSAVAFEKIPETGQEWRRRVRIGAGNYQAMMICRRCLLPEYGWFSLMFWSHKVLRWFTPHFLLLMLFASGFAIYSGPIGFYAGLAVLTGACALLLLAVSGGILRLAGCKGAGIALLLRGCSHFIIMQVALMAGFLRFCAGGLKGTWGRTDRGVGE